MKLFVWADPYTIPYGSSLLIAVAETVEEAREAASSRSVTYSYGKHKQGTNNRHDAAADLGEPTRVVDIPCAEWHEWEE